MFSKRLSFDAHASQDARGRLLSKGLLVKRRACLLKGAFTSFTSIETQQRTAKQPTAKQFRTRAKQKLNAEALLRVQQDEATRWSLPPWRGASWHNDLGPRLGTTPQSTLLEELTKKLSTTLDFLCSFSKGLQSEKDELKMDLHLPQFIPQPTLQQPQAYP